MNNILFASFCDELMKIAAAGSPDEPQVVPSATDEDAPVAKPNAFKPYLKGLGGFALGAGLGYTGAHLADRGIKRLGGDGVPLGLIHFGAPLVGAGAGLGLMYLQDRIATEAGHRSPGDGNGLK